MTKIPVIDGAERRCTTAADKRSLLTLLWAAPLYWLRIFPTVTRELRRWQLPAERSPIPACAGSHC